MHKEPAFLSEDKKSIILLDQTLLPNECKYITVDKAEDIWEAIYSLRVRGAPAIGCIGAYAYYVLADKLDTTDMDEFVKECTKIMEYINSSRPTAVNLSWALNRMHSVLLAEKDSKTVAEMKVRLMEEADAIREEDIQISRNIGKYGFELLEKLGKGVGIMTHCNAGTLATAKYGTALAPMYIAMKMAGIRKTCMCTVMRPGHCCRVQDSAPMRCRQQAATLMCSVTIWRPTR